MHAVIESQTQATEGQFTSVLPAARYIQTRAKDYIALTHELAEAETIKGVKDLGYCKLDTNTMAVINSANEKSYFRGITEASAFILRKYW